MQQTYQFHWKRYRREFKTPLRSAHGDWRGRDGIVIKIVDEAGRAGYGEMAPIPAFGCEPLEDCVQLCHAFGPFAERAELEAATLPTARFAVGSALAMIDGLRVDGTEHELACLLPAGEECLDEVESRLDEGWRVFKRKVVRGGDDWPVVHKLLDRLQDAGGRLRIDANAAWSPESLDEWQARLAPYAAIVDFIEQPFARGAEAAMARAAQDAPVPLALDETVTGIDSLEHWLNWQGPLVIKPALAGHPLLVRELMKRRHGRVVFSSALETRIGAYGAFLAAGHPGEPMGFGVQFWQDDGLGLPLNGPRIDDGALSPEALAATWSLIGNS